MQEARLKFSRERTFQQDLQARVDACLAALGKSRFGTAHIYLKTALLFVWAGGSYAGLLVASEWWQGIPLAASLALALAALGFNVSHDGNHGAVSPSKIVNRLMGATHDLLGASSYVWRFKHNVLHHSYPNVHGLDDDIDLGELCRMSSHQKHRFFHRIQHLYMWPLYGFILPKWHFYDDFAVVIRGKIGDTPFARPKGWDLALFLGGKLAFITWTFIIPAVFFHSFWVALLFYGIVTVIQGITLSIVFQLAHSNEESESYVPEQVHTEWAIHQIETTANFARKNRLLTWYVGGLNHQIEHHLFPRMCHIHLPAIAHVVEETCRDHGIRYNAHPTFRSALASHYAWLRALSRPPQREAA